MAFDRLANCMNDSEWKVVLRFGDLLVERLLSTSIRPVEASFAQDSAGDGETSQRRPLRDDIRYFAFFISPVACRAYLLQLACGGRQ
jgi:hypothetical protein